MVSVLCLRSLQYRPLADCIRRSSPPITVMVEQDSGDYAGYEQALQNGFSKAIKAPKKVCPARVLSMACLLYVHQACLRHFVCMWVRLKLGGEAGNGPQINHPVDPFCCSRNPLSRHW